MPSLKPGPNLSPGLFKKPCSETFAPPDSVDLTDCEWIIRGAQKHLEHCAPIRQGLLPFSSDHPHKRYDKDINQRHCSIMNLLTTRRRATRNIIIILLLTSIIVYFAVALLISESVVTDNSFASQIPEELINERVDFKEAVIDKMCSNITKRCYSVVDKKRDADSYVERHLIVDGFQDESDSIVRLIPPPDSDFVHSDTRIWTVDHNHLNAQYIAGMAVAPFLTSTFSLEKDAPSRRILEIGLGGGALDMFLLNTNMNFNITIVELDPTIKQIAEKWFDVTSQKNRQTIVGDGILFMKEMQKRDEKVDVLFIDACDTSQILPCPAEPFWSEEVVRTIRNILNNHGTVVINILQLTSEGDDMFKQVITSFTEVFPTCFKINMIIEANVILFCVPYEIQDVEEHLVFYTSRLNAVVKSLNLSYILNDIKVSSSFK